jgi:hypothetical protein
MTDDIAASVLMAQADAAKRGALVIWTIYDRPKDHPYGFIARRFEVGGGGGITATDHALITDLEGLREIFAKAGLVNICRQEGDEPQIVESWV